MIALFVAFKVKPELRDQFLAAAEDDSTCSVRDEGGGCLRFDVYADQSDSNRFFFHEVYRDEAALDAHRTMPHFARWRAVSEQVLAEPADRQLTTVLFPRDYK
ncbi:MAG: antibiotic biosynthesis monooxygenase [Chloroflexi bacterium]|nr:antibiotic biosynthesis monooxygenase [Chloroflexota bacterium]